MAQAGTQTPDNQPRSGDRRLKYLDREMARHSYNRSGLLEVLFKANALFGSVSKDILHYIAHSLHIAPSRAYSVATFYSQILMEPRTGEDVRVCSGVTCRMHGSEALLNGLADSGIGHRSRNNGQAGVRGMRCSGLCGYGPVAAVNESVIVHATPETVTGAYTGPEEAQP